MQTIIFLIIGVLAGALIAWFLVRQRGGGEKTDSFLLLQNQMNELSRVIDKKLGESSQLVNESLKTQFGESQRLVKEITRELTEVKETGKQMVSFADQLQSLQDILKNPKQRGILGEYYLETL